MKRHGHIYEQAFTPAALMAAFVAAAKNKRGNMPAVISSLGHARYTHSLRHMLRHFKERSHVNYLQLPEAYRLAGYTRA